jgi:nitroreductase
MVRLGPSASNKQPWRFVRQASAWHLYLHRTPGYGKGISSLSATADLQRVDMGIAMSHFALTARESGLEGGWHVDDPGIAPPDEHIEYVATWA